MAIRPSNEFNAFGLVSQDMQLRLLALAQAGNTVIVSTFTAAADAAGLTERGREALERRRALFLAAMRLATQEQLAAFHQRLDRLERASYEALLESEERLTVAGRVLEQLRERAYQITMPDGRSVRVYRDGDIVREETGAIVSPETIRAEDVPSHSPTWQELQERERAQQEAMLRHREIVEYRERLASARDEMAGGNVTAQRADELDAELGAMPEPVRLQLGGQPLAQSGDRAITQPGSAALAPGPM